MKLFVMQYPHIRCYLLSRRPKYLPQHPILEHSHPIFYPLCERPSFIQYKTTVEIIFLYILIFMFFGSILEDKRF